MSAGGISFKESQVIGWALFGICFLYALWLCTKDFSSLLKGCCLTMFAFLPLKCHTYTQVWYLIWPFALAMLVPETWLLLAAILPLYAAYSRAADRRIPDRMGTKSQHLIVYT